MSEHLVGTVSHYWGKPGVAGVELSGDLEVGDTIHIRGHSSDFVQTVESIQIEHEAVEAAGSGDAVGLKVSERARIHDEVFVVTPD